MLHSAGSVTGASPFPLNGSMALLFLLKKMNCHWSFLMYNRTKPDLKVKDRWRIFLNGLRSISRPIQCPVMQEAAGIFFVIWIHTMKKNSAIRSGVITGTRWTCMLEEQNTP